MLRYTAVGIKQAGSNTPAYLREIVKRMFDDIEHAIAADVIQKIGRWTAFFESTF